VIHRNCHLRSRRLSFKRRLMKSPELVDWTFGPFIDSLVTSDEVELKSDNYFVDVTSKLSNFLESSEHYGAPLSIRLSNDPFLVFSRSRFLFWYLTHPVSFLTVPPFALFLVASLVLPRSYPVAAVLLRRFLGRLPRTHSRLLFHDDGDETTSEQASALFPPRHRCEKDQTTTSRRSQN